MKNTKNRQKTVKRSNTEQIVSDHKYLDTFFHNIIYYGETNANIDERPCDYIVWYCKCRKSKGTPIGIYNNKTQTLKWVKRLPKHITRYNCKIKMSFDNAIPLARKSGASTVLEVWILKPEPKRY